MEEHERGMRSERWAHAAACGVVSSPVVGFFVELLICFGYLSLPLFWARVQLRVVNSLL